MGGRVLERIFSTINAFGVAAARVSVWLEIGYGIKPVGAGAVGTSDRL